jgi:hypothetical protein
MLSIAIDISFRVKGGYANQLCYDANISVEASPQEIQDIVRNLFMLAKPELGSFAWHVVGNGGSEGGWIKPHRSLGLPTYVEMLK